MFIIYKQLVLLGLFPVLNRHLSKAFLLVPFVDPLVIEVSKLDIGLEGGTEVFSDRSFRVGCEPRPEAARYFPAVEEVCWRLPPPARAVELGFLVVEAFVIVSEVSVVRSRSQEIS